jgi:FkbM family methyltransferase
LFHDEIGAVLRKSEGFLKGLLMGYGFRIGSIIMDVYQAILSRYRKGRVLFKRAVGMEPTIKTTHYTDNEYHGNEGYGGWSIPVGVLRDDSTVVDVGLGEDISFSESLIARYGCRVHGFDPTPRAIDYLQKRNPANFHLHTIGVAGSNRTATFFLPNNPSHVSGSITKSDHVGDNRIEVRLIDLDEVFGIIGKDRIDLLKIDIEGAEYELLSSASFKNSAVKIHVICVEFHHRWNEFGPKATLGAVATMRLMGFECVWYARESNEEFTFINTRWAY